MKTNQLKLAIITFIFLIIGASCEPCDDGESRRDDAENTEPANIHSDTTQVALQIQ